MYNAAIRHSVAVSHSLDIIRCMRIVIFICIISIANLAICQTPFEGDWTDGFQSFYMDNVTDKVIQFYGGDLHEGGSSFYGELLTNDKILIRGGYPSDSYSSMPHFGEIDDIVEFKKIEGFELLILKSPSGQIKEILRRSPEYESLKLLVLKTLTNHLLSGKYEDSLSGKEITFYANRHYSEGIIEGNYKFETEFDQPRDVISYSDQSYHFIKSRNNLKLYSSLLDQHEHYIAGELKYNFTLLEHLPVVKSDKKGNYQFASEMPMISKILWLYSIEELRIIRNEIFARYGHQFKSPDLKEYFESQSWYQPTSSDVTNQLTELEKLNAQLIKYVEAKKLERTMSNSR